MFVPAIGMGTVALMTDATGGGVFCVRESVVFQHNNSDEHYWLAPVVFRYYADLPDWLRVGVVVGCRYFSPDLWYNHGDVRGSDGVGLYWHRGVGETCEVCSYLRRVAHRYDRMVDFIWWLDKILGILR